MSITIYDSLKTGYKIQSVEDVLKIKDYGIIGSRLTGTDDGIEFRADVKIGEEDGSPIIASYYIFENASGSYCHHISEGYFEVEKSNKKYNCSKVVEISDLSGNTGYLKEKIGCNGYLVATLPRVWDYNREKVKATAFRCLEKHYKPTLTEVFSLLKNVEQMKITPDEDVFVSYGERAKVGNFLEKRGIAQKIKQACENIANYRNIPEKPKTIEDIQKPKEIFFGYTYNEDGEYKDKVILEGKSAVAKFVANTDENLNRVITNVKKQYLMTTLGNSIYKFAPEVRTKDREEFQKLLEEEIDALSKDDEER